MICAGKNVAVTFTFVPTCKQNSYSAPLAALTHTSLGFIFTSVSLLVLFSALADFTVSSSAVLLLLSLLFTLWQAVVLLKVPEPRL